jgi:hypothetical protein
MRALRLLAIGLLFVVPRIALAEDPFADFVSPVTNPTNFEDPRSTTEFRPIYMYHKISREFAQSSGVNGGDSHIMLIQGRVAMSERFSLILSKAGYVWLRPKAEVPGILEQKDGWANTAFGMKYAVLRDAYQRAIGTIGLRYEAPSGTDGVLQGKVFPNTITDASGNVVVKSVRGDGVMNPFLSAAWGPSKLHLMGYAGWRIPINGVDSTFFDFSVHADYRVYTPIGFLYPLIELNWIQTLDGGRRVNSSEEGFDFFNFGSRRAGGNGVVTLAAGARMRLAERVPVMNQRFLNIDLGAAFEAPVTAREDFMDWRVTSDLIFRLL